MSVNSSSSSSVHFPLDELHNFRVSTSIFTALFITYILLLPLFVFVLYVGCRRWRKRRSAAAAAATTTTHSDIFTFHMVVMEIIGVLGSCVFCYGSYAKRTRELTVGINIYSIVSPGQTLFHLLTCVERYLAVVHPVTYLGLRQTGGVRIRNVSVGCVWLLCFGSVGLSNISLLCITVFTLFLLVFSSVVVSFCSLSVLCVLVRPGPGEVGGDREFVDQSKRRAFHTIMAIMAALISRFLVSLVSLVIYSVSVLSPPDALIMMWSTGWLYVPSSLVLPLLFLHRAGKLPGCKRSTASPRGLA